jgi:site-specific recombinase XerD
MGDDHCSGAGVGRRDAVLDGVVAGGGGGVLGRYAGLSRAHTASDLRGFLVWCADRGLDPLAARRPQLELFVRWMQETRRLKPSTVSRRTSVVAGFYRTCVIDGVVEHSLAEHLRRPRVPPESPTLGLTHVQFETLLTAARDSANVNDFALVAMLGLLGLRVFEACGSGVADLGGGARPPRPTRGREGQQGRSCAAPAGGRTRDRPGGRRPSGGADPAHPPRLHPHMLRHTFVTTMLDAGVDLRDVQIAARHADPRTTMRYDRARKNLDRHPNHFLAAFMGSGT